MRWCEPLVAFAHFLLQRWIIELRNKCFVIPHKIINYLPSRERITSCVVHPLPLITTYQLPPFFSASKRLFQFENGYPLVFTFTHLCSTRYANEIHCALQLLTYRLLAFSILTRLSPEQVATSTSQCGSISKVNGDFKGFASEYLRYIQLIGCVFHCFAFKSVIFWLCYLGDIAHNSTISREHFHINAYIV